MKKTLLSTLFALALVGCAALGTGSSFQTTAGKFLSSVAVTVDGAMKGWAIWVVDGHTTTQDEAQVKAVYTQYQFYMKVATNAYSLAVSTGDTSTFTTPSNNLFMVKNQLVTATQAGHPLN